MSCKPMDRATLRRLHEQWEKDEEEFKATITRAKESGVDYIWSGDLARSEYLRNCLHYAEVNGLVKKEFVEMEQESGYRVWWT